MPSLTLLETFAAVARQNSFAAAARQLGVSASAAGKAVARLEIELGVALLVRTTRHVELTDEGRAFLNRLSPVLDALTEAVEEVKDRREEISGHLRLTLPLVGYHLIIDRLEPFLSAHPAVSVELIFSDAIEDLVAEGIDIGIRSGALVDSSMRTRPFLKCRHGLFASPAYLASRGVPTLGDLASHSRIAFRSLRTGRLQPWTSLAGAPLKLPEPQIIVTAIEGARIASRAGLGIAWLPDFILSEDLTTGRLVPVLPEEIGEEIVFHLIWPAHRAMSRRLRAMIDHLCRP